ncbi:MAG: flagellar biosynthetic protein FliO [Parvularculaceae bacterium]
MDILDFSRIFFALIAVLGLIGLCAMIARKAGLVSGAVSLTRRRRLSIIETLPLDARRRAALIRCDGREHLVILGATSETIIDANIPACAPRTEAEPAVKPPFADAFARLQKFAVARNPYRASDDDTAA